MSKELSKKIKQIEDKLQDDPSNKSLNRMLSAFEQMKAAIRDTDENGIWNVDGKEFIVYCSFCKNPIGSADHKKHKGKCKEVFGD